MNLGDLAVPTVTPKEREAATFRRTPDGYEVELVQTVSQPVQAAWRYRVTVDKTINATVELLDQRGIITGWVPIADIGPAEISTLTCEIKGNDVACAVRSYGDEVNEGLSDLIRRNVRRAKDDLRGSDKIRDAVIEAAVFLPLLVLDPDSVEALQEGRDDQVDMLRRTVWSEITLLNERAQKVMGGF